MYIGLLLAGFGFWCCALVEFVSWGLDLCCFVLLSFVKSYCLGSLFW